MAIRSDKIKNLLPLIIIGVLFLFSVFSLVLVVSSEPDEDKPTNIGNDLVPTSGDAIDPVLPACNGISVSKTLVASDEEEIDISVNGSFGSGGTPKLIALYAAVAGQVNKMSDDRICNNTDPNDPQYSYYCKGPDVWFLVDEIADATNLSLTTTYEELREIVLSGNEASEVPFVGDINELGIQLTVNVSGATNTDLCSSNIAYANGDGARYFAGSWNNVCTGGCHPLIKLQEKDPSQSLKCEDITLNKETVSSGSEEVTITVRGANGTANPGRIQLYAAAAGQVNENPEDFICVDEDEDDPQYSYYCGGPDSWFLVDEVYDEGTLTTITTFDELKALIDGEIENGANEYMGRLDQLGIRFSVNIVGDVAAEFCSANVAYNDGRGVYYNNAQYDVECSNGCNKILRLANSALTCGGACTDTTQCSTGLSCVSGICRNAACPTETDCTCASALTCNQGCTTSDQCATGLICSSGSCRNPSCSSDADCVCNVAPPPTPPPVQTVARCQQACSASVPCAVGLTCTGGKCVNSVCSTDTDCVCGNVPVSQLPQTADGDEMVIYVVFAFGLFVMAGLIALPSFLPERIRVGRPERFRRDF